MAAMPGKARLYGPSLVTLVVLLPFFAYYVRQVKTQEGYLNSRAFRVLDVAAHQFAAQLKGASDTMVAAVRVRREYMVRKASDVLTSEAKRLSLLCPDTADCQVAAARAEAEGYLRAYLVDRDSFTYEEVAENLTPGETFQLSRRHGVSLARVDLEVRRRIQTANPAPKSETPLLFSRIRATLDPARMLNRAVGREVTGVFDTVILATRDGAVLAQTTNPAANVREIEALLAGRKIKRTVEEGTPPAESANQSLMFPLVREPSAAAQLSGAEERVNVDLAGEAYVLFSIPAPVSLVVDGGADGVPLVFYGLSRKDAVDARAMELPSLTVPALLISLVMGMALLWPILQIQTMSPKERLRKSTLAFMAGSSILAGVLFAALFLVTGFAVRLNLEKEAQLTALSGQIQAHFAWEVDQAIHTAQQAVRYQRKGKTKKPEPEFTLLSSLLENMDSISPEDEDAPIRDELPHYPYFVHLMLTSNVPSDVPSILPNSSQTQPRRVRDGEERQIIKISSDPVPTPLIPLPARAFPFVDRLRNGPFATLSADKDHPEQRFTIESLISPSTGEFLPVLMFNFSDTAVPFSDPGKKKSSDFDPSDYRVMVSGQLPSLVKTTLPRGFGFAVVNNEGLVLFHSDSVRNLKENFYTECSEPDGLEKAVVMRSPARMSMRYGGRNVRMFVQPLGAKDSEDSHNPDKPAEVRTISNLDLSVVVYYDADATKDLYYSLGREYLAIAAGVPFAGLLLVLLGIRLRRALFPRSQARYSNDRLWPWEVDKPLYILEGIWGIGWFLFALLGGAYCHMEQRGAGHPPVTALLLLSISLSASVGGLILSWSKHHWALQAAQTPWLTRLKKRIPLSAAFSLRLYTAVLAFTGPLSLIIFQIFLWQLQNAEYMADVHSAAAAIEARTEGNYRAWSRSSASAALHDAGAASSSLASQFQFARVAGAGYFDIYDPLACPDAKNPDTEKEVFDRFKSVLSASLKRLPAPPEYRRVAHAGVWKAGPCVDAFRSTPIWRVTPEITVGRSINWSGLGFYSLGILILCLLFLWKHFLVRRLFLLDFRQPEPLPHLDEAQLRQSMSYTLGPACVSMRRTLIFAHPRAGTGEALRRIVEALKEQGRIPSGYAVLDCPALLGGQTDDDASRRKALIDAQATGCVAILDNFATGLVGEADRKDKLVLLEKMVYARKAHVYVITSIDPVLYIHSLTGQKPEDDNLRQEADRWTRVLSSFERVAFAEGRQDSDMDKAAADLELYGKSLGLSSEVYAEYGDMFETELNPTAFLRRCASRVDVTRLDWTTPRRFEQSMVTQVRALADGYYSVVWLNCTGDERLVLFQLAKDDWMNPLNKVGIAHVLRKGLIHNDLGQKDGAYRLMNESFRQFVLEAVEEREAASWAAEQNRSLWPSMRIALMLAVGLLVLFMAYVRRDLFDVYFSYFAALAGGSAALLKIVFQIFSKDESKLTAALVGGKSDKGGEEKA